MKFIILCFLLVCFHQPVHSKQKAIEIIPQKTNLKDIEGKFRECIAKCGTDCSKCFNIKQFNIQSPSRLSGILRVPELYKSYPLSRSSPATQSWYWETLKKKCGNKCHKIKILALGDSWFAFPHSVNLITKSNASNVLSALNDLDGYLIYSRSVVGGEVAKYLLEGLPENDLSLNSLKWFQQQLQKEHFDYVLISGGGNDLFGPSSNNTELDEWKRYKSGPGRLFFTVLKDEGTKSHSVQPLNSNFNPCNDEEINSIIDEDKWNTTFKVIKESYKRILEKGKNKNIRFITHTYAPAFPGLNFVEYEFVGHLSNPIPYVWIYPDLKRTHLSEEKYPQFTRCLLRKFADTLKSVQGLEVIESDNDNYFNTCTSNDQCKRLWRDEIHLSYKGMGYMAYLFDKKIMELKYCSLNKD
jgi:lysophospholipase L1-like esterase